MEYNDVTLIIFFYIVHALVMLVVMKTLQNRRKQDESGVHNWILFMSICIPVIGTVFGYAAFFASRLISSNTVSSYDEYIDFQFSNYEEVTQEAKNDLQLVSFSFGLQGDDSSLRKDLIVRLLESDIVNRGRYLEMALGSADTETVHYAATTMNHLKERYEKKIDAQFKQLSKRKAATYLQLCQTYRQYIHSEVISSFMRKSIYEQFEKVVSEAIDAFPHHIEFYDYSAEIYQKLGKSKEAYIIAENMIRTFPNRCEGYVRKLELSFYNEDMADMLDTYHTLMRNVEASDIPPSLHPVLAQIRSIEV